MHPVARELAPAGLRSSPWLLAFARYTEVVGFGAAAHPSGSKLPRHKKQVVVSVKQVGGVSVGQVKFPRHR
ncbi:hypothetical protein CEQ51_09410 [Pseudomonas thivervalensis]|uniref:Uncharacterized protein n=1 Tax=Pseudomonas thivervalensis TaxID=86265 RepID=A0A176NGK2_9PSED|nr:hypothetical protein CE140_09570 [Pseudomonas thivervalensis]AXA60275.1 hypothetical protein CEQ51_09410 [Pseudomonas thivervalensis]OAB50254.1 hypothetical protein APS14_10770 [Pseudomonas thivervalensis]